MKMSMTIIEIMVQFGPETWAEAQILGVGETLEIKEASILKIGLTDFIVTYKNQESKD